MDYFTHRRSTLAENFPTLGIDAFLVTSPVNVTYLTGFTGDDSYFVGTAKHSIIVSDTRFEEQIKEECTEIEASIRSHNRTTPEAAADVLSRTGAKAIGVEANRISVADLERFQALMPKVNFVPLEGTVEAQRLIKDPGEVEKIREAVRVAERAFRMFTAMLCESDSEKFMADALDAYLRRAGARCAAFPPILAVGERGALPHAPPTSKQLGETSKLLVDWGADLLYKSDLTRTLKSPFGIKPSSPNSGESTAHNFDEIYQAVLAAQNAAIAAIRPGVKAKEVDAAARQVFASTQLRRPPKGNLADYFTHGLGHGIGLEIHEAPRVRANSEDVLAAGMVITIEPGIYIPGWGGVRIEDDILVTPEGCELLSTLPRELSAAAIG